MQETKMTTNAMIHWVTLVISVALIIWGNCSFDSSPKGRTMRDYLIIEFKVGNPEKPEAIEFLDDYEAKAQKFYDQDLKDAQNPKKFHHIESSDKYISLKAKKIIEAKLKKMGRSLEDETFIPVLDVNGNVFIDTRRFHEEVWGSRTAAEAVMRANQTYYEEGNGQFIFWAGARSPERQAISQAIYFNACEGKWTTKVLKFLTNYKCEKSIGSEVGSCFGTSHHPGFAFDLDYGHMKNAKRAKELLEKEGFVVGCSKDLPHIDWAKDKCW